MYASRKAVLSHPYLLRQDSRVITLQRSTRSSNWPTAYILHRLVPQCLTLFKNILHDYSFRNNPNVLLGCCDLQPETHSEPTFLFPTLGTDSPATSVKCCWCSFFFAGSIGKMMERAPLQERNLLMKSMRSLQWLIHKIRSLLIHPSTNLPLYDKKSIADRWMSVKKSIMQFLPEDGYCGDQGGGADVLVCVCIRYMHLYICMCKSLCMYMCTYTHIFIYTYKYTHKLIHICARCMNA